MRHVMITNFPSLYIPPPPHSHPLSSHPSPSPTFLTHLPPLHPPPSSTYSLTHLLPLHYENVMPGEVFSEQVADMIKQGCRKTVIILSPAYLRSPWCSFESHLPGMGVCLWLCRDGWSLEGDTGESTHAGT